MIEWIMMVLMLHSDGEWIETDYGNPYATYEACHAAALRVDGESVLYLRCESREKKVARDDDTGVTE